MLLSVVLVDMVRRGQNFLYARVRRLELILEMNFELALVVIFSGVGHITADISATLRSAADLGDRTPFFAGLMGEMRLTSRIS